MLRGLGVLHQAIVRSRPGWAGVGQYLLVALGVHLASGRSAELGRALWARLNFATGDPLFWADGAAWAAIALEIAVLARAWTALTFTPHEPTVSWRSAARAPSVERVVLPLFWAACAASGAWSVGLAVEDLVGARWAAPSPWLSYVVAGIVGARLGAQGLLRVIGGFDGPARPWEGALWAPVLLLYVGLAVRDGLPLGAG